MAHCIVLYSYDNLSPSYFAAYSPVVFRHLRTCKHSGLRFSVATGGLVHSSWRPWSEELKCSSSTWHACLYPRLVKLCVTISIEIRKVATSSVSVGNRKAKDQRSVGVCGVQTAEPRESATIITSQGQGKPRVRSYVRHLLLA